MCLDVEVDGDKEVPNKISTKVEEGRATIILIAELPPPPPRCHKAIFFWSNNKRSAGPLTPAARAAS